MHQSNQPTVNQSVIAVHYHGLVENANRVRTRDAKRLRKAARAYFDLIIAKGPKREVKHVF